MGSSRSRFGICVRKLLAAQAVGPACPDTMLAFSNLVILIVLSLVAAARCHFQSIYLGSMDYATFVSNRGRAGSPMA